MIDAKDRLFRKMLVQGPIERLRRFAIVAERFLDDQARVDIEPACGERVDDDAEQARGNREVVQRPLRGPERLLEGSECPGIAVVAVDIAHESEKTRQFRGVSAAMALDARLGARL